ncbi:antibiotic biosynthesis monooxygenase family protein [Aestuariibaculum lutulentum]|uniref:Antibiotic biosynthesis monooxygenase n=1 Tax=Aestuariibaculum lutulentum TaxID=2920935 RepID=A0ABS9RGK2_9FLAO|nr:antibiotic biosynthesis monooxygenase [Aestuariibaculum lutulentum]MCH4552074.1 antibiotic biosynthesis monooxygenase [Aestuariibaculum lutulentum]
MLYSFEVKQDQEAEFITAWTNLTNLIYEYEGSLGSKLHKGEGQSFIAYAQWPSQEKFEQAGDNLPEEANKYRDTMRASCEKIEVLQKMEVVKDVLKQTPNV